MISWDYFQLPSLLKISIHLDSCVDSSEPHSLLMIRLTSDCSYVKLVEV